MLAGPRLRHSKRANDFISMSVVSGVFTATGEAVGDGDACGGCATTARDDAPLKPKSNTTTHATDNLCLSILPEPPTVELIKRAAAAA